MPWSLRDQFGSWKTLTELADGDDVEVGAPSLYPFLIDLFGLVDLGVGTSAKLRFPAIAGEVSPILSLIFCVAKIK